MGMSYSNDLRLRVPVDGGVPVRQIAALLRVSVSYLQGSHPSPEDGRDGRRGCRAAARPATSRAMSRRC